MTAKPLSRSTSHRINRPAVIALALAALRLRLHLPAPPKPPAIDRQMRLADEA